MDILDLSVRQMLDLLNGQSISSAEVCQAFLRRIHEAESINAVVFVDDDIVMAQARSADKARARGDNLPLLGIPFSVKDSIAVAQWPWRSGSFARIDVVADRDATAVARLRAQGAIPLCKTSTPEYTWSAQTHSALHGRTNNPYDLARSAGGSSGGEAALHAVQGAPFGLGSDGFNSIRVPAHFCGSTGLRPTSGIVSEAGTWPLTRQTGMGDISTVGPMGRFAGDLDLILTAITGTDPEDPFVHPLAYGDIAIDATSLRIGVLPAEALSSCSPATITSIQIAVETLVALGGHVVELSPWDSDIAVELAFALMAPDGGAKARANLEAAGGRHTKEFSDLLDALAIGRVDIDGYLRTLERLRSYRSQIRTAVAQVDVAIIPVASGAAPLHDRLPGNDDNDYDVSGFAQSFAIALAGLPSAVVPVSMDGGLPVGVQIVGSPHCDLEVLRIADAIQIACASRIVRPTAWMMQH
jgi:amidase